MQPGYIIVALLAYLLGSIPFGYLLVRGFLEEDIRAMGSGNIGATNVARSGAKGLAIATLFLDAGKGFIAVKLAEFAFANHWSRNFSGLSYSSVLIGSIAALFAVTGHCFPVWLKFKGGKGVATALGVFFALAPKAILVALGVFIGVLLVWKFVSLGSIIAAAVFPLAAYLFYPDLRRLSAFILVTALCVIVIIKHRQNIVRLSAGKELRFGVKPV